MSRLRVVGALDVILLAVALVAVAVVPSATVAPHRARAPRPAAPPAAAVRFLHRYVDPDGRVVRRDQGGDTVSEGQAYAMLLAVAAGDRDRFAAVWRWTQSHLERPDRLLAWHWVDGRVVDAQAAADADVDAARALLAAGTRFAEPRWSDDGRRLAVAIADLETAVVGGRRVLVAGPWARDPVVVNPGYVSPAAFDVFARVTGDRRWRDLAGSDTTTVASTEMGGLPSDWARAAPGDGLRPTRAYGLDATRAPIRFAEDCDAAGRRLAASWWPQLSTRDNRHAAAVAAAGAAAWAAGQRPDARRLLDAAERRDHDEPTYFGGAVVALARVLVTTDVLSPC